jgi:hypothetical protein
VRTLEYVLRDLALSPPFQGGRCEHQASLSIVGIARVGRAAHDRCRRRSNIDHRSRDSWPRHRDARASKHRRQVLFGHGQNHRETTGGITGETHGTKSSSAHDGSEALDSLKPGAPIVAHYAVKGIQASAYDIDRVGSDGLNVNEGIVTSVDRARSRITIKLSQGPSETLRLTRHAAQDADGRVHSRVIVYHSNDSGQIVAHYFKLVH